MLLNLVVASALLSYGVPDPVPNFKIKAALADPQKVQPVPVLDSFKWGIDGGILTRNGKPFFWLGNGVDLGAAQATPVGLWLAKVQGVSAVATPHNVGYPSGREDAEGVVHVSASAQSSAYSWLREIVRLGFLAETCDTSGNAHYCSHLHLMKKYPPCEKKLLSL